MLPAEIALVARIIPVSTVIVTVLFWVIVSGGGVIVTGGGVSTVGVLSGSLGLEFEKISTLSTKESPSESGFRGFVCIGIEN